MSKVLSSFLLGFLWVIPFFLFLLVATATVLGMRFRRIRSTRLPVEHRLLRAPGESLSREIERVDDQFINFLLIGGLASVLAFGGVISILKPFARHLSPLTFLLLAYGITLAIISICALPLSKLARRRWDLSLGLRGERAVGEELNKLMLEGCHVFHDFPAGPTWNIDHVIVARTGVYAVETKTRRKPKKGTGSWEIIYDGESLQFPTGYQDRQVLEQARRNAAGLSDQLSKAVGEPVKVNAILTFPGWFVMSRVKSPLRVLNPKQIKSAILSVRSPELPPALRERIAYQLDQKCRDVEF